MSIWSGSGGKGTGISRFNTSGFVGYTLEPWVCHYTRVRSEVHEKSVVTLNQRAKRRPRAIPTPHALPVTLNTHLYPPHWLTHLFCTHAFYSSPLLLHSQVEHIGTLILFIPPVLNNNSHLRSSRASQCLRPPTLHMYKPYTYIAPCVHMPLEIHPVDIYPESL